MMDTWSNDLATIIAEKIAAPFLQNGDSEGYKVSLQSSIQAIHEASKPNTYKIGPLTAQHVFKAANLTNMSDMQAVMDAVEVALDKYESLLGDGYQMFGNIAHNRGLEGDDIIALLDKLSES